MVPAGYNEMWSPEPAVEHYNPQQRPYALHQRSIVPSEYGPTYFSSTVLNQRDYFGKPKLHRAADSADTLEFARLLSQGAALDILDAEGNQPLHLAIIAKNTGIVDVILASGANVNAKGAEGKTPVHLALHSPEALEIILRVHPDLSILDNNGDTALHAVLSMLPRNQSPEAITTLILHGAGLNTPNFAGITPFHMVLNDMLPFVKSPYLQTFLQNDVNILSTMKDGALPFQVFVDNAWLYEDWANKWLDETMSFLNKGAKPDTMVNQKQTLLYKVLCSSSFPHNSAFPEIFVRLCETADIHVPSGAGDFPLHLIMDRWMWPSELCVKAIDILFLRGTDPNQLDGKGRGLLQILFAQKLGTPEHEATILETLLRNDVDPMRIDSSGQLPIYALYRKCKNDKRKKSLKMLVDAYIEGLKSSDEQSKYWPSMDWWIRYKDFHEDPCWSSTAPKLLKTASSMPDDVAGHLPKVLLEFTAEDILNFLELNLDLYEGRAGDRHLYRECRSGFVEILRGCQKLDLEVSDRWYYLLPKFFD